MTYNGTADAASGACWSTGAGPDSLVEIPEDDLLPRLTATVRQDFVLMRGSYCRMDMTGLASATDRNTGESVLRGAEQPRAAPSAHSPSGSGPSAYVTWSHTAKSSPSIFNVEIAATVLTTACRCGAAHRNRYRFLYSWPSRYHRQAGSSIIHGRRASGRSRRPRSSSTPKRSLRWTCLNAPGMRSASCPPSRPTHRKPKGVDTYR